MSECLNSFFILISALFFCSSSFAADASMFKPPSGAKVAIVMFEDLQGPECARAYSLVWEAANARKVPVVLHDFPLPRHNWSFEAAVWARYFDKASGDLGNEYRKFIYANQAQISRDNLLQWVHRFGAEKNAAIPSSNDPDGTLAEKVKTDFILGQRIGVEHPPTIWVISNSGVSQPLVEEAADRGQLNRMIEEVERQATGPAPAKGKLTKRGTPVKIPNKKANLR